MPHYLDIAKAVALEAGGLMTNAFGIGVPHAYKDDYTPVSEVDTQVNALVITRLSEAFPEHCLLGEEGSCTKESEYTWVFDPIDGTAPYVRGIPTNVFSLGLVKNGVPVLGVVYDPYMDRLYHAVQGESAFLNGERIHTSAHTELSRTYIETDNHRGFKDMTLFQRLLDADVRFLSYSSTVYSTMLVAAGQIEGVVYPGTKPWDAAAAKVIIEEAGGVVTDKEGNEQRYDGPINGFIAACTRDYHDKLRAVVGPSL
ncbi:MAG: inositol monophosphatase [Patescibacteria group bacterium]